MVALVNAARASLSYPRLMCPPSRAAAWRGAAAADTAGLGAEPVGRLDPDEAEPADDVERP